MLGGTGLEGSGGQIGWEVGLGSWAKSGSGGASACQATGRGFPWGHLFCRLAAGHHGAFKPDSWAPLRFWFSGPVAGPGYLHFNKLPRVVMQSPNLRIGLRAVEGQRGACAVRGLGAPFLDVAGPLGDRLQTAAGPGGWRWVTLTQITAAETRSCPLRIPGTMAAGAEPSGGLRS